jgi:hypothetical protein
MQSQEILTVESYIALEKQRITEGRNNTFIFLGIVTIFLVILVLFGYLIQYLRSHNLH